MLNWFRKKTETKTAEDTTTGFFDRAFSIYLDQLSFGGMPARKPERFSQEGYVENVVVAKCVREISYGLAALHWMVYYNDEEVDGSYSKKNSPEYMLYKLLLRPNARTGRTALLQQLEAYKQIAGNSYLWAVRPTDNRPPTELHVINPQYIKVYGTNHLWADKYEYIDPKTNDVIRTFNVNHISGQCDLLHLKFFNPSNRFVGLSPIEHAAYSIDIHNESNLWNYKLLHNDVRPSGVLSFEGMKLTKEQREFIKENLESAYSGAKSTGRPLVLEGTAKWQQMGISPKDLDFVNGKNNVARDIATAFRVPPVLVNLGQDVTYANQEEARLSLYEETIFPEADELVDELNNWLVPMFDASGRITIRYDKDSVSVLEKRNASKWDRINNTTFLTLNEKRELFGYEQLPGGDSMSTSQNPTEVVNSVEQDEGTEQ